MSREQIFRPFPSKNDYRNEVDNINNSNALCQQENKKIMKIKFVLLVVISVALLLLGGGIYYLSSLKKTPIKVKKDINYLFMKQKINKLYSYLVSVPEHRLDIKNKEDLVEEIIKIYGYNNISSSLPA